MKLTLKPIGPVEPGVLEHLRANLLDFGEITLGSGVGLPSGDYEAERDQYRATRLFEACLAEPGDRILGVTEADLYEGELRSVFGYAQIGGRVAVISLARLRGRRKGPDSSRGILGRSKARARRRFLDRCTKEATHELGHTLGLAHDEHHPECVMYYSERLADTDRKGKGFCPECAPRAELSLRRLGK